MKQIVDVLTAFDIGRRDPRPIKFKFIESGKN